ncbi:hypothetical protein DsansV1_C16g0141831 [Dioscorea sansibarensis]
MFDGIVPMSCPMLLTTHSICSMVLLSSLAEIDLAPELHFSTNSLAISTFAAKDRRVSVVLDGTFSVTCNSVTAGVVRWRCSCSERKMLPVMKVRKEYQLKLLYIIMNSICLLFYLVQSLYLWRKNKDPFKEIAQELFLLIGPSSLIDFDLVH